MRVLADKRYSTKAIRAILPEHRAQQDNRRNKGLAGGRPPAFDAEVHKHRNVAGRRSNRLKQFRTIATRSDKTASRYRATPCSGFDDTAQVWN